MSQTASADASFTAEEPAESVAGADSRGAQRGAEGPTATFRRAAARARRKAALDDQKRSFLRMVSHELRTPLNAVIGFSEILASELYGPLGSPQYKEYAKLVHESGLKLLKLVNQIVEIARLEGHVTDLDVAAEPLDEAVEDVMAQLRAECEARGVVLSAPDLVGMPGVLADRRGLRTILSNLMQNAVAHSPRDGVVTIEAERVAGGMVEISIRDQGEGVETADLPRLLRPFEQGGASLTRTGEGVGLGLPIVDLLTRAMNGSLRLKSAPGQGLTAIVSLPGA
ncbi:HAMP domain-containing sensor histidine kinase [Caulobacter sp. CCNWLY153]|jgi:signal transduction histidine kinase|uniref:histidine kinase n=1 Tax=Caulobacter radicis TaxID=2172650 RepID=A0A2T9JDB9_9CAUL|nr:HAMP domain-containing sensor histidine kinase [Caulobacter radicis]PVM80905.1 sensor histidine kinase [Caulobacter radicis]